jgi:protoporphyrin/coproporphyrin ferrochelatase
VLTGDPYRAQCEHTAALLTEAMGWRDDEWLVCFQSQFGPEEWLQPYTEDVITGLHGQGVEHPLVFSPGFVTDCLETLDELGNEGREQFEEGGGHGEHYHLASCLNAAPPWLDALATLVRDNAGGWVAAAEPQRTTQPMAGD